jgi:hypothetical protein
VADRVLKHDRRLRHRDGVADLEQLVPPPGSSPMYCLPSRLDISIFTVAPFGDGVAADQS